MPANHRKGKDRKKAERSFSTDKSSTHMGVGVDGVSILHDAPPVPIAEELTTERQSPQCPTLERPVLRGEDTNKEVEE